MQKFIDSEYLPLSKKTESEKSLNTNISLCMEVLENYKHSEGQVNQAGSKSDI